jgi:hypothetical protein
LSEEDEMKKKLRSKLKADEKKPEEPEKEE